ncbi:hypothetical protein ANN_00643, partial [Periplaneta americana]
RVRNRKRREFGVHPINRERGIFGEFHHLYGELRRFPDRFFEYSRMSIQTFDFLLNKIKARLQKQVTNFQRPISPTERLTITLRIYATTNFTKTKPSGHQRWGFPNCFGPIDGKHCQVKCPDNSGSSYFNYLKYFSVVLQALADADKKFLTIEVGARGKQSDGSIFTSSTLFNLLETNQFNVANDKELPNSQVKLPLVLIGDEAYPLKPYLMRPYPGRGLTPRRDKFNERLSSARKCVECAFGILRTKWRFLDKNIDTNVEKACTFIKCACILHNLIREKDGDSDLHYREMTLQLTRTEPFQTCANLDRRNNSCTEFARHIREKFTDYFNDT